MTDDAYDIRKLLLEAAKKVRAYAGFRSGFDKATIERGVVSNFVESYAQKCGTNLGTVRVGPDPPDCEIVSADGRLIGFEVSETVDQNMRAAAAKAAKQGLQWARRADWPKDKLVLTLDARLREKDSVSVSTRYQGYILLLHTDETMLGSLEHVAKTLSDVQFAATALISEAWLIASYHRQHGYPILRLKISGR
jgi:hypothetical protein